MTVRTPLFVLIWLVIGGVLFAGSVALGNDYIFFAGYVVLQYIVLATAWNILGGYTGYVNFGTAAHATAVTCPSPAAGSASICGRPPSGT